MMKSKTRRVTRENPETESLFQVISRLSSMVEVKRFLGDLLTPREVAELSRRWQVARLLDANISYSRIVALTGLSSTTVARIAKCLRGDLGGYRLVLRRTRKT